jgi:endonuclease/exonuclease/phosphatase family metal-dependent hydrolase
MVVILSALVWVVTYHPDDLQIEPVVCLGDAPLIKPGQSLKILTWNVQYMAGKNYVFWYDRLDGSGPDERPSSEDIASTLSAVARVIKDEDPDIILLQEVDDGARRTDYEDQLEKLLALLPKAYVCHTSAFYWKASFVPHPKIMGSVGMKLSTISKYKIDEAIRHQLARIPEDPISRQFNLKRAILDARFPQTDGKTLAALNVHLDAFAQGTRTMELQVEQTVALLKKLSQEGLNWIIGGDFNLLPPGGAYDRLVELEKKYYNADTEIEVIFGLFRGVPGLEEVRGPEYKTWFTHIPNKARIARPDRTIDYIFISDGIQLGNHYVRRNDTLEISDHLPVVAEVKFCR